MNYLLILISVCLSAFSQVILRYGMTRPAIAEALAGSSSFPSTLLTIAKSPFVIGGLACYGFGAILWLFVLSKIPVSFAYPFVSLGIVLTTITGVVVLRESISLTSAFGVMLVIGGILMMALGRA
ncbi:SMR family transporter [Pseudomonas sp. R2.Fl]|nr:SMR family transporter [Pseudomonas sp. R2.Fl]